MDRCQGAIREIHTPMPFGNIILVGRLVRAEVPGFFLLLIVVMIIVNVPEIPGMGMGCFHMGALMVFIGMGVEKQERREGEKEIGYQHEAE